MVAVPRRRRTVFLRRFINKASAVGGGGRYAVGWGGGGGGGGVSMAFCSGRMLQPQRKAVEIVIRRVFFALCENLRYALLVDRSGSKIVAGGWTATGTSFIAAPFDILRWMMPSRWTWLDRRRPCCCCSNAKTSSRVKKRKKRKWASKYVNFFLTGEDKHACKSAAVTAVIRKPSSGLSRSSQPLVLWGSSRQLWRCWTQWNKIGCWRVKQGPDIWNAWASQRIRGCIFFSFSLVTGDVRQDSGQPWRCSEQNRGALPGVHPSPSASAAAVAAGDQLSEAAQG